MIEEIYVFLREILGTSFLTLGIIMFLGAMLPGPDFAIVTKNALLHSRRAGLFTALGICTAMWVHMTYCVLGIAVIIQKSPWIFHTIQYIGALYLIYLGGGLLKPHFNQTVETNASTHARTPISGRKAFQQGFICNLFNPKATLFFLTIFSAIATTSTTIWLNLAYAIEMFLTAIIWFCSLAYLISHDVVTRWLSRSLRMIERILGIILLGLAVFVIFWA